MQTQWNWVEGQRAGLNYAGVEARLNHWPVKRKEKARYFELVGALEGECLSAWAEER